MSAPLFVGLDAGGTKTAVLATTGGAPRRANGPGAQFLRDGLDATADTLAALVDEARAAFGGPEVGGVAVGLAGAGRPGAQEAVAEALRQRLGGAPVVVMHDAEVALEATYGSESGAVVLVGTGAFVFARGHEGERLRAGGWGALLGDDGSGTALGRAALRAVLAAHDGGPPTALVDLAAESYGLGDSEAVLQAIYGKGRSLASYAPLLLRAAEAEDWVASSTLSRETNALAQQAGWLATRAGDRLAHRIVACGGLSGEPVYRRSLEAALERHLPGWTISRCVAEPVEGALAVARRLADPVTA